MSKYSYLPAGSPMFSFNTEDAKKVAKGLAIAMLGAGLTYLSEWASGTDFGAWTPLVVTGFSVAVNAFRKWTLDTTGV